MASIHSNTTQTCTANGVASATRGPVTLTPVTARHPSRRRMRAVALASLMLITTLGLVAASTANASIVYNQSGIGTADRLASAVTATAAFENGSRVIYVNPGDTYARAKVQGDDAWAKTSIERWNGSTWVTYLSPPWVEGQLGWENGLISSGRLVFHWSSAARAYNLPRGYYRARTFYRFYTHSALVGSMNAYPTASEWAYWSPATLGNTAANTPGFVYMP